eukprot:1158645-Pelagomonas_calceolata.AAC.2
MNRIDLKASGRASCLPGGSKQRGEVLPGVPCREQEVQHAAMQHQPSRGSQVFEDGRTAGQLLSANVTGYARAQLVALWHYLHPEEPVAWLCSARKASLFLRVKSSRRRKRAGA